MKNLTKPLKLVLLGPTTVLALGVSPVLAATSGVSVRAVVLPSPIAVTQTQTMNFGSLTESTGGTLRVDHASATTVGGSVNSMGGTIQPGGMQIKGNVGPIVSISGPASAVLSNGTATMTVNQFTISGNAGTINATPVTRAITAATEMGIYIGGTLNVGAGQPGGTYNGTTTITTKYQ